MLKYINHLMRVTLSDSRVLTGRFLAFDPHMNVVLSETTEERRTSSGLHKRALGLVLLRGNAVVTLSVAAPPPPPTKKRPARPGASVGRGAALPAAGRGRGAAQGLAGPVGGIGIGAGVMQPHVQAGAVVYPVGRGQPMQPGWMGRGAPMPPPGAPPPRPPQ